MSLGFLLAQAAGNSVEPSGRTAVETSGGFVAVLIPIMMLAVSIIMIAGTWKMFTKAGKPGWACLVPIYNVIVMLEIAGKPLWWIILCFIPVVNLIPAILVPIGIAKNFGRGMGTAVGLFFLSPIFCPILGFGSAVYSPVYD